MPPPAVTSTVPDVKLYLVGDDGLLPSASGLAGIAVTYGHPGRDMEREFVYVGGTVAWDEEWASLGAGRRTERYTLELIINVTTPGNDQREATERAFALLNEIGKAVLGDPTLGGRMLTSAELVFRTLGEGMYDEGREAQIAAGIRCDARLSRPT